MGTAWVWWAIQERGPLKGDQAVYGSNHKPGEMTGGIIIWQYEHLIQAALAQSALQLRSSQNYSQKIFCQGYFIELSHYAIIFLTYGEPKCAVHPWGSPIFLKQGNFMKR